MKNIKNKCIFFHAELEFDSFVVIHILSNVMHIMEKNNRQNPNEHKMMPKFSLKQRSFYILFTFYYCMIFMFMLEDDDDENYNKKI